MKLVERAEPQAARLARLSGASPEVVADAQTYTELEARVLAGGMEGIALRYGFYYGPGTWFHPDGAYADKVRRQEFRIIGAGSGVWSWVHVEDVAWVVGGHAQALGLVECNGLDHNCHLGGNQLARRNDPRVWPLHV
jgi:nucleoside-diphosphate-sugar epimerase